MKKIVAVILAVMSMFTTIAIADSAEPSYLEDSLSTMEFIDEIQDRIQALTEKKNPTDIDVELGLQYAEVYVMLLNLSATEMTAVISDEAPELNDCEELREALGVIRSLYYDGTKTASEVISIVADSVVGD